jgi:CBS domain containing-hemolysin-like protein
MQGAYADPLSSLVAVVLLLAANAFFVGAEFALVKVRGSRVQALADEGHASARLVARIQSNLEAYLAACQLGITMASLGLGWVGEPAVAALLEPAFEAAGLSERALHTASFLTGFLAFSSLHIVVGEQVPKTLAIRKPMPVSLWTAYLLHAFYLALYPLTWLLNLASRGCLALLGIDEDTHADALTSDELRGLIDVSTEHGHLGEDRAAMLHNLFQFDDRPVQRIMVPRREVDHLDLSAAREENGRIIRETNHSRLPLVDGDWEVLAGVVLVKEVLTAMVDGVDPLADLAAFAHEPVVVPESQRVAKLFETMRTERAHMAFVLDEYGEFVGLATLEDLVEEIVGEIADESDDAESAFSIRPLEAGWEAHGLAPLPDVERATGFRADAVDANTLSGLFMKRLERMPAVGDEWIENGFRLRVCEIHQRHVRRCELVPLRALGAHPGATPAAQP